MASELEKGIFNYVDKVVQDAPYTQIYTGVIKSFGVNGYTVLLNGVEYPNVPSKGSFLTNETVKVVIPNNQFSNMFILSDSTDGSDIGAVSSVNGMTGDVVISNVDSADKLSSAKTITLSGDVAGSVSTDFSTNPTISVTVVDDSHNHIISNVDNLQTTLNVKADLVDGKVPSSQLPSFVDDVLEYTTLSAFPTTGTSGIIYVDLSTNLAYRWSGTVYVEISPSLALGETSSTAYRGDRGAIAYNHSLSTSNPHSTTASQVGLGNVPNVTTNNQTPSYTMASGNADLVSGETLTIAFGKIAKSINSLIAHIANNIRHITSIERTNWNVSYTNNHIHSNKTILDNTTASYIATDKTKLDGIESGAQVNDVTGVKGDSEGSYRVGNVNITKANIGLGSVDNTADINKNVLSATKLTTARTINDVSFDGTANIEVLANPKLTTLNSGSLDNVLANGFYNGGGGNAVTEKPSGVDAFGLIVYKTASGYTTQDLVEGSTNSQKRWSRQFNGSAWSSWIQIYTSLHKQPDVAKLTTARTISLTGDVTGSVSFDGSANVSITSTVADDSHNHVISNVDNLQTSLDAKAPLVSPSLTGTPTSTTATANTNTTQIATTAFVVGQAGTVVPLMDGSAKVGTSLYYSRQDHIHPSDTNKANLASPTFTGVPLAPTATQGTNTTQIATTAFVQTAINTVDPSTDMYQIGGTYTADSTQTMSIPTIIDNKISPLDVYILLGGFYNRAILGIDYTYKIASSTTIDINILTAGTYIINYGYYAIGYNESLIWRE